MTRQDETGPVHYAVERAVATLTLARPEARNALRPADWQALGAQIAEAARDPAVRVLVLCGAGGNFCAGGDIPTMPERLALPLDERRAQLLADAETIAQLVELDKPVIARIEGAAVGAGLALALACDVRIATAEARLGAAFHRVGLSADFGLSWLLPRLVGLGRALDLLLSARLIEGAEAQAIGLISRSVAADALASEVDAYAARLAASPPLAVAASKRALWSCAPSLRAQLIVEAEAQARLSHSADAHEGVAAFLAKRPPRFTGR